MTAVATSRTSEWCAKCTASVFHDTHPEFAVRGTVEVQAEFNVDLVALVKAWPDDWARIRDEQSDLQEALGTLIYDVLIEGEDWAPFQPKGFFRLRTDEPDLDWWHPRGDETFWDRLTEAMVQEGLWGDADDEPSADLRVPGPGQLGLDGSEVPA